MKKLLSLIVVPLIVVFCTACTKTAKDYFNKGQYALSINDYDGAIECYKKVIELDPDFTNVYFYLGNAYFDKGMQEDAIREYKKAITVNPGNGMAHLYLGAVYLEKGLESLAADHFYRAGLLFLKQGDREKALMAYELLKGVNSKEQEQKLYEQLFSEVKHKKSEKSTPINKSRSDKHTTTIGLKREMRSPDRCASNIFCAREDAGSNRL